MIRVIGSDVTSARWKSSSNDSESAFEELASPKNPISTPGLSSATRTIVASGASTRSSTVSSPSSGGSGIS
jgi:hypothetical protein